MKVLIVDDEELIGALFKEYLDGYAECEVVYDGKQAIKSFKQAHKSGSPFDLICMDIMMPQLSGRETLQVIRDLESDMGLEGLDKVKVIMISAKRDTETIMGSFFDEKCDAYLRKPIDQAELIRTIDEIDVFNERKTSCIDASQSK